MRLVETLRADYRKHGQSLRNLGFWVAGVYHFGVWSNELDAGPARKVTSKLYGLLQLAAEITTGSTIHREAEIGPELHLVHGGNIHIHPGVKIGRRCGIMHDVTIGTNGERPGVATIGDDVFIGAGAKILGELHIGDGARIGANSLVLSDVPAGTTAVGVPARIIRMKREAGADSP